jgi:hypothetical protein
MTRELSATTTTTNAYESLRARGVVAAKRLASEQAPDLIGAWCERFDHEPEMGPGALVAAIRSGSRPPAPRPRSERGYAAEIRDWLTRHVPEVCPDGEPHPAAVAALIRLHHRYGREAVSARAHGAVIRAEVRAARAREA